MRKTLYTASTAAILLASVAAPNAAFASENSVVENQQTAQTVETTDAAKATEAEAAKATETEAAKATEAEAAKATETEAAKAT